MNPAPYNTETPFTAADIERFNRFTNFPKSQEKENIRFAEETRQERAAALVILKRAGQDTVPYGIERALEGVRKARYETFMTSVRSREIAPPLVRRGACQLPQACAP